MLEHDTISRGGGAEVLDRLDHDGRSVDGFASGVGPFVVGVEEQVVDEGRHPCGSPSGHLACRPEVIGVGIWVGHDDVEVCSQDRQRIAEFMGCLLDKASLALEGDIQSAEHVVERVGHVAQFVIGATEFNPAREVGCRDLPGHR